MSKTNATFSGAELKAIVVALLVYLATYGLFATYGRSWLSTPAEAGLFGDMFGAFNAFFSGLAMFGVVGALMLQRRQNQMQSEELALQRQELADTRIEIAGQTKALEGQLLRWDKDYIERHKPIVFVDRVSPSDGGHDYVMRNVGGGVALNVYFVPEDATPNQSGVWPVRALGSLAADSEKRLPDELSRAFRDSTEHAVPHLLIAEGLYSRTTQWTPTLNYRSPDYDPAEGHVEHRVATVLHPSKRFERQSSRVFLASNAADLLQQLTTLGSQD